MGIVLLIIPYDHLSKQVNDSLGIAQQKVTIEVVRRQDKSSPNSCLAGLPPAGHLQSSMCLPMAVALLTRRTPTLPSVNLHITGNSFKTCSMIPWWVLTKSHSISLGVCEKGRLRHTRRLSCCFVRCTCVWKEMTWHKEIFKFLKFPLKQSWVTVTYTGVLPSSPL